MKIRSPSLRWRLAFWLFTLMVAASVSLSLYYHYHLGSLLEREADARIATLARHLSAISVLGVLAGSEDLLSGTMQSAMLQEDVLAIDIFDADGRWIASTARAGVSGAQWAEIDVMCSPCMLEGDRVRWVEPVTRQASPPDDGPTDFFDGTPAPDGPPRLVGWIVLEVSTIERQAERRALLIRGITIAAGVLFVGFLLTMFLSTKLTSPLRALARAMQEIGRGYWNVPISEGYPGEVKDLADAFRDMAAALAELDKENRRYREDLEDRVRQRTAELQTAYEEMKALNEEKDRFVSTVSHDFRSPLAIVLSCVQTVLADEEMPSVVRKGFLSRAERQCHRLQALVSNLLDLARIENRAAELAPARLDELVGDYVESQTASFAEKKVNLRFEKPVSTVTAEIDRRLVERALGNLLDNALKFTPEGGCVAVGLKADQDAAHVTVSDTGGGIPEEELPQLFERFFQGEQGASRGDGSGLGLAIVAEVVRKHGGHIDVQSELGAGTTFDLTLPLEKEGARVDHSGS